MGNVEWTGLAKVPFMAQWLAKGGWGREIPMLNSKIPCSLPKISRTPATL